MTDRATDFGSVADRMGLFVLDIDAGNAIDVSALRTLLTEARDALYAMATGCRSVSQETIEDAWSVATWHLEALKLEDDADGDEAATCRRLLRAIPRERVPWVHPNQKLEEQEKNTEQESVSQGEERVMLKKPSGWKWLDGKRGTWWYRETPTGVRTGCPECGMCSHRGYPRAIRHTDKCSRNPKNTEEKSKNGKVDG